jgi:hypothetical protein
MSEENLAIVQQFVDQANQQDIPGFLALLDPEVEFHTFRGSSGAWRRGGGSSKEAPQGALPDARGA